MVGGENLAQWLSRLVRIPSVAPTQAGTRAGEPGEARIAAQVERWFRELGAEVETETVLPGRPNVYGFWKGSSDRLAVLDVHLDTVGVEQMLGDPFSGEVSGGKVHGRGSVDTKASLGVALALLESLASEGRRPGPNLLLTATVDEEVDANGAPACAAWLRRRGWVPDQMMVAEPTLCAPVVAHKGVLRLEFTVEGVPAHSSQPGRGRNAVTAAAHVTLALAGEHERLAASPASGPLGPGTLTVTQIHGGRGLNVVPDCCVLGVDRRLSPGERGSAEAERIEQVAREACPLPLEVSVLKSIDPFSQPPDSPWVRSLCEWAGQEPVVAPYCTNAWAYCGLARELVVMGPGSIDQAHGVEEWVEIAELEKIARVYSRWWGA